MALNRDKFRKIVGGITTATEPETAAEQPSPPPAEAERRRQPEEQGAKPADLTASVDQEGSADHRRFAKRGRPKASKEQDATPRGRKVKVSLFLSEKLVNDLYNWAHDDRIHPGEMFERALKPFHEKEAKRRNGGKE